MSDYLWLLGAAAVTVVTLLVANLYFKTYFRRILLCLLPLALAAWVGGEACTRQMAATVNVSAGEITTTTGARLDKTVDFRAEITEQSGSEKTVTPTAAIAVSTVESLAKRWYEGQIERLRSKEKDNE